ncbi:MAG: hypothetical protein BWY69_01248 [Planctomycetes bacterium ADurb.Bin401]|nr:MAG: hypothetical protein BWY69_01248 [Planctomycetes bacterium ADurb.Bin401]
MKANTPAKVKEILSKIIPDSSKLRFLSYLPKLDSWITKNKGIQLFEDRFKLYDYLNSNILKNEFPTVFNA